LEEEFVYSPVAIILEMILTPSCILYPASSSYLYMVTKTGKDRLIVKREGIQEVFHRDVDWKKLK
jgi:hypothetical protein